jgi:hypothetical protein
MRMESNISIWVYFHVITITVYHYNFKYKFFIIYLDMVAYTEILTKPETGHQLSSSLPNTAVVHDMKKVLEGSNKKK